MDDRAILIRDGTVIAMDRGRSVQRADVWIDGSTIAAIGVDLPVRSGTRVIDARGCAVLPGLVQTHVHLCQALFRGMADELPLMRWLRERIWPLEAAHDAASMRASARLGIAELLKGGTTSILDMGSVHHHDAVFAAIEESGIRAWSGKAMMDKGRGVPRGLRETRIESLRETERLIQEWHGAANGRIAYAPAPRFVLSCSERLMREVAVLAERHDLVIHSHVAEHAGERDEVRAALGTSDVEALAAVGVQGPRAVLAHGVQLSRAEMRRMAKSGTRIVHCPSANLKLGSGIADVVAMREAGIVVGIGADGAPCNNRMDGFTELRQAALLAKAKRDDAAALAAIDALAMITIDGARVLRREDAIGSIEVGKKADVIVVELDRLHAVPGGDPVGRVVYSTTASDVRHVIVDGRWVVRDRELTTLDEREVLREAAREGALVAARAGI